MIPDWLTVFPCLPALSFCRAAIQLQLAGDHSLSEVSFADRFGIEQEKRIAQTRFLFPEGASDLCKNFPTPDFRGMRQRRRARIRIHGRAVGDNQKRNVVGSHGLNVQQPALGASRMGPTRLEGGCSGGCPQPQNSMRMRTRATFANSSPDANA